jgi:hypothetical protein
VAFVVEDDTGLDTATSYVTVEYSEDYLGASWAGDEAAKQAALMVATEYVDVINGPRIKGYPLETDQALEFPRTALYNRYGQIIEGVPDDLKKAVCRYAQLAADDDLCSTSTSSAADAGVVKRKRVKAGSIESDIEYFAGAESALQSACAADVLADRLVKQYLTPGLGVIRN